MRSLRVPARERAFRRRLCPSGAAASARQTPPALAHRTSNGVRPARAGMRGGCCGGCARIVRAGCARAGGRRGSGGAWAALLGRRRMWVSARVMQRCVVKAWALEECRPRCRDLCDLARVRDTVMLERRYFSGMHLEASLHRRTLSREGKLSRGTSPLVAGLEEAEGRPPHKIVSTRFEWISCLLNAIAAIFLIIIGLIRNGAFRRENEDP